jgi:hypothetical protein
MGLLPRDLTFDPDRSASLWQAFRRVLRRHPGIGNELYPELYSAYKDWAEDEIRRR